jgi:hypothetical protein
MVKELPQKQVVHKIDEVELSDNVWIVIQRVRFKGKWYIDIRKRVETEKYKGLTSKGIFIPADKFPEVLDVLKRVKV